MALSALANGCFGSLLVTVKLRRYPFYRVTIAASEPPNCLSDLGLPGKLLSRQKFYS